MQPRLLSLDEYRRAVSLRDLTDPHHGAHAMQQLVDDVSRALASRWRCAVAPERRNPVVPIEDNYDRLRYPKDGAARDARYTRYVSDRLLLRTQTSAMIPDALAQLAARPPDDVLLVCPGLVYRRDVIDRLHSGEPHQLDLWRVRRGPPADDAELDDMIAVVTGALLPGRAVRTRAAIHPYTERGREIEVAHDDGWVEIGECGVIHPALTDDAGLPSDRWSGLAMGLGLDRVLMLRKGIDDIRLLRSDDERVQRQMLDLSPWVPVSRQPAVRRDLSLAVDDARDPEELGDRVRAALGDDARLVEEVALLSLTPGDELPAVARARLGLRPGQRNALVRVVLRDLSRALSSSEANVLRDRIYAALHEGDVHAWASG